MNAQAEAVAERLQTTSQKWWVFSLLTGAVLALSVSGGALLFFILIDALFRVPRLGLVILFSLWFTLTMVLIISLILRTRRSQRSPAATARRVELEFPELGSNLINLVMFSELNGQAGEFARAAAAQSAAEVGDFPFDKAATKESRWRRFILCLQTPRDLLESAGVLAGLVALACFLNLLLPHWSSSAERLLHPWTFVPAVGSVKIVHVTPGDTEILIGASLEISAEIDNPGHRTYPATLFVRHGREPETAQPLLPDGANQKFVVSLAQVLTPIQYRLEIGDSQTRRYTVGVQQKPAIADVEVNYYYPSYLARAGNKIVQKHADLEAPQFTLAELLIHPTTPVAAGHAMVEGQRIEGKVLDDGKTLLLYLLLKNTTTYTVHLFNAAGQTDSEPRVNQVRVTPDAPPTVHLVEPSRESNAAVGGKVSLVVRATDDIGLGLVRLELKSGEDGAVETLASWTKFPSATSAVLTHQHVLDKAHVKPGQTLLVRAVARDGRKVDIHDDRASFKIDLKLEPQETATPWQQIRVISSEAKSAADLARLESLRAALFQLLQKQLKARVATVEAARQKTQAEAARIVGEVRKEQVEVQKNAVDLVQTLGKTEHEDERVVRNVLNKLALGDMLEAVRQVDALGQVSSLAGLAKPAAALNAVQDRIIDVLRRLLNEVRRDTAELLAEMQKRPGGDLPSDVQNKLREAKAKLEDFLKQQKKVIEATENLAKMPVEDFTEKEQQLLKELAAKEDDWSRFMADLHSDLSKLPEQDFANPSLLEELIEVQTELKMAKDALTKKSADIAVPLEQLGAEMAKELTTNIEKWLPDTPDRERWSQEEPLTDEMKEAPMAELPGELEDIVGELMEGEEDLFDEMEDISSSWADSIDKGAGWDAADGPISNMSAKGVTGNRLPNTSEISGRSGEGRQGKASGEFVGESAVGKGGRKTPSRLTPDPYVKGQVKDHSKDPVGGATGGGKESGQGGEGLEGPVPKQKERSLERLAGKQAELRNKAEAVDLQFKVHSYHHTDLKKLIEMMAAVEHDLRGGRYQNALRRREVLLEGLGQVKTYLQGEFTVRKDLTSNLPTDIQKEILGNMREASPAGWDRLNRQYFDRLATSKDPRAKAGPLPATGAGSQTKPPATKTKE